MHLYQLVVGAANSLLAVTSLISTVSGATEPQWLHDLARDTVEGRLEPRNNDFQPVAVRKMGTDAGEMFFQEYWGLQQPLDAYSSTPMKETDTDTDTSPNNSSSLLLNPLLPLLPHSSPNPHFLLRALQKRSFNCPDGTNSCASIGASYGCCPQGTTCQLGSSGELGCCPGSQASCSGSTPTQCEAGYTPCPQFHGGSGCCLKGFTCQSDGCKLSTSSHPTSNLS